MTATDYDTAAAAADSAAAAAARARRALLACVFVLACAAAVLAIDHGTKRQLLDEAKRLRVTLDEVAKHTAGRALAETGEGGSDGTAAAPGEDRDSSDADLGSGDPVEPGAGTRAAATADAKPGRRAAAGGPRSSRAGTRRDG